jgi:hypothetical protein
MQFFFKKKKKHVLQRMMRSSMFAVQRRAVASMAEPLLSAQQFKEAPLTSVTPDAQVTTLPNVSQWSLLCVFVDVVDRVFVWFRWRVRRRLSRSVSLLRPARVMKRISRRVRRLRWRAHS